MPFQLAGIENEYSFELRPGATMVVGRAVNSDCAVVDATVSRRHAEMTVANNGIQVKDVGSSNGTFVNGVKVDSYFVVPGDTLTFGKVAFRLEELAPIVVPEPELTVRAPEAGGPKAGATIVRQVPSAGESIAALGRHSGSIKAVMAGDADPAEKDRQKLQILLEVSKGLTRATDVDALLRKVADYAFQILEADRCAILLIDENGQLNTKISRDKRGADAPQAVPQSIARMAVDEKVAVLSDNAGEDQRFTGQSILMQRVRSALCAPLIGSENKVLGVLYVDNFQSTHRFGEADLDFLIAFAGIAAVAIENGQFGERIRRYEGARPQTTSSGSSRAASRGAHREQRRRRGNSAATKRPVAVLFSDIRGFTALSETMDPDAMAKLLTEYFTQMVDCVFRHGGTLDKFIGDAVMAQWGAPLGESDDVDRAMESALDMMEALDQLNERWTAAGRPTPRNRRGAELRRSVRRKHRQRASYRVHRNRRHCEYREPPVRRRGPGRNPGERGVQGRAENAAAHEADAADGAQEQDAAGEGLHSGAVSESSFPAPSGYESFLVGRARVVAREPLMDAVREVRHMHIAPSLRVRIDATRRERARRARNGVGRRRFRNLGVEIVVRHSRHGGTFAPLTGDLFLAPTRAPAELSNALRLADAGVPTAEVVAYAVYPAMGPLVRADVATRRLRGADFPDAWRATADGAARKSLAFAAALAYAWPRRPPHGGSDASRSEPEEYFHHAERRRTDGVRAGCRSR